VAIGITSRYRNDLCAAYRAIRGLGGNMQAQHSSPPIKDASGGRHTY